MFKMGPVVSLRAADEASWKLSILVVADAKPPQLVLAQPAQAKADPELLWTVGQNSAWRYVFKVALDAQPATLSYAIGEERHQIRLPAAGSPPRMAYASCNGFSSLKAMKGIDHKNALWTKLASKHRENPYSLLLMGGDQVYADSMWETVPLMKSWASLAFKEGNAAKASPAMQAALRQFYFDLYTERWSQPEVRPILATIPTVMMWDDHDLIDGWGSYPATRQECDVFQKAIWPAASKAFRTFQQQLKDSEKPARMLAPDHGFSFRHVIGRLAIVALDMRSERSADRILTQAHWDAIYQWLDELTDIDHLLILSSIPVVYPGFETLERVLGWLPGHQELEDDLRDHWNSRPHKGERLRLVHRLFRLTESAIARPTLISGDVHVAALGYVESDRSGATGGAVINQIISSAIVHPGPPAAVVFALRHLFDNSDEIDRGIVGRMVDFPGTQVRFIGKRNFMTLEPDARMKENFRLWVNWWFEGEAHPYTKVIHPLERRSAATIVAPELPKSKAA